MRVIAWTHLRRECRGCRSRRERRRRRSPPTPRRRSVTPQTSSSAACPRPISSSPSSSTASAMAAGSNRRRPVDERRPAWPAACRRTSLEAQHAWWMRPCRRHAPVPENGTLAVMASGPRASFELVEPLLAVFGKVFLSSGRRPASARSPSSATISSLPPRWWCRRGAGDGVKAGIDPKVMLDIINAGSGRNSATQDKFRVGAAAHLRASASPPASPTRTSASASTRPSPRRADDRRRHACRCWPSPTPGSAPLGLHLDHPGGRGMGQRRGQG